MLVTAQTLSHGAIAHAFFTREGGVSEGMFASLNCGARNQDPDDRVRENRTRALAALGFGAGRLATVRQVHGTRVVVAHEPGGAEEDADALVTDQPDVVLGILTADCAPVLLADPERGIIGAAHAGWRGALAGIIETTVCAMTGLGARSSAIRAAVGPCIAKASYEVGPELRVAFTERHPEASHLFEPRAGSDRLVFDLKGFVRWRLEAAGVGSIEVLAHDTQAEEDRFFSCRRAHRRAEPEFGLMLSAIARRNSDG